MESMAPSGREGRREGVVGATVKTLNFLLRTRVIKGFQTGGMYVVWLAF